MRVYSKLLSYKGEKIFSLIFVIIGLIILVPGLIGLKSYNDKKEKYIEKDAAIIDYSINEEYLKAIIVQYEVDGEIYTKQDNIYTSDPKEIGETISIYYNPNNPDDIILQKDFFSKYFYIILGGTFTFIGLVFLGVFYLRNKKSNKEIIQTENLTDKQAILIGVGFVVLGIILLILHFYFNYRYNLKNEKFIETNAIVIEHVSKKNDDGNTVTALIIQYEVDGKTYTKNDNTYTSNPKKIGSTITIKYNPDKPSETLFGKTILNYILLILGSGFVFIGVITSIVIYKVSKETNKQEV